MHHILHLSLLILFILISHGSARQRSLYDILGVPRDATQKLLKRAYHRLALELHPDKNKQDTDEHGETTTEDEIKMEEIVRRFIEVVSAYEILSDPDRRRRYDTMGDESLNRGSARERRQQKKQYGDQPFHMYSRFPGGSMEFHYTGKKIQKMETLTRRVDVTLESLFSGPNSHNLTVHRQRLCHHCHGTGAEKEELIQVCPLCQGTGFAMFLHEHCEDHDHDHDDHHHDHHDHHDHHEHHHHHHPKGRTGMLQQIVNTTCGMCSGSGKIVPFNATCSVCGGGGTLTEPKVYTFDVVYSGQQIRFADGGQALNHVDGEVIFEVHAMNHARFKFEGSNLIYDARVALVDALVGFKKFVRHLDGRRVPIVHDIVTFHGYQHVIKNEGLPTKNAGVADEVVARGDLIVNFDVVFPRALTDAQREALRAVMDDDDVGVLEDVIALATATQDAKDYAAERLFSNECAKDKYVCKYDVLYVLCGGGGGGGGGNKR